MILGKILVPSFEALVLVISFIVIFLAPTELKKCKVSSVVIVQFLCCAVRVKNNQEGPRRVKKDPEGSRRFNRVQ